MRDVADRLAEILTREGGVADEALRRAVARQEEAGGALDTALLELEVLDEERLTPLLARAAGLPAAPPSAWGSTPFRRARRNWTGRCSPRPRREAARQAATVRRAWAAMEEASAARMPRAVGRRSASNTAIVPEAARPATRQGACAFPVSRKAAA